MKKYTLIIIGLFGLFCFTPKAHAAFTFDASSTKAFSAQTTVTSSLAVGSGSNELFVIEISDATTSPSGVTIDGVAATKAISFTGTSKEIDIWYATGLSNATHNVSTTFGVAATGNLGLSSYFGAAQSSPLDAVATSTISGTTISSTITTLTANDLLVDGVSRANGSTNNVLNAGQVAVYKNAGTTNTNNQSYYLATSTQGYKLGWTIGATPAAISYGIAAFKPYVATPPHVTSVSTTTGNDGAISGKSVTITGTNFGTVATSSAAICNGTSGTGCIQFIVGGTDTVPSGSITSWADTSITFTVPATLGSNGGTSALQVWAASASDTSPFTYYIYPNIITVVSVGSSTNAARLYNAADTDGLIMLSGDHFGTVTSTATILGSSATLHYSAQGSCSVAGYASTTACYEVPASIATNTYSGTITLSRGSDAKQATTSLSILPRILSVNPASTSTGDVVQIVGDHLCQGGTCPVSPNRATSTNKVVFGSTTSSDSDFVDKTAGGVCNGSGAAWDHGEICVKVPASTPAGSASTTVTSNGSASNIVSFTVTAASTPGTPGTPTYSSVNTSTLTVSWASSTNTTYYKIERATSSQFYAQISTTSALSYADSGLTANTAFYYQVRGDNNGTDGSYSPTSSVITLPDIPGTPTYTGVTASTLNVNWTAPTGGAASYIIQRATSSQVYAQVASTTATSTADSGLTASTTYFYKVQGVNATGGNGLFSATSSVTTATSTPNSPPGSPSEDSPASAIQNSTTSPVFMMTATDTENNALQYKVTIYSNAGCTTVIQTNDESASQTGWSGQNTSSSMEYTAGTQGTYTTQSALATGTTYYWKASAKDPEGSNTWTDSTTCNSFATTYGTWTTDSGNWSISGNQLVATPSGGSSIQLHITGQSQLTGVIEFQAKSSGVGANSGNIAGIARANSGTNRWHVTVGDFLNQREAIGKTLNGAYTTLAITPLTFSTSTFYEFRGSIFASTTLKSWINGGTPLTYNSIAPGLTSPGFFGVAASSTNGSVTFTVDNFAWYTSTVITLNREGSTQAGGSWGVRDSTGAVISCASSSITTLDVATYSGQIPIDYSNGGGSVGIWDTSGNGSCSGQPTTTYPPSGLATDIFGGDTYYYATTATGTPSLPGGTPMAASTITVSPTGLVSY